MRLKSIKDLRLMAIMVLLTLFINIMTASGAMMAQIKSSTSTTGGQIQAHPMNLQQHKMPTFQHKLKQQTTNQPNSQQQQQQQEQQHKPSYQEPLQPQGRHPPVSAMATLPTVHKKRTTSQKEGATNHKCRILKTNRSSRLFRDFFAKNLENFLKIASNLLVQKEFYPIFKQNFFK